MYLTKVIIKLSNTGGLSFMRKKIFSVILAASMVAGLMSGCGSTEKEAATPSSTETTEAAEATQAESTTNEKVTVRLSYWNSEDTVQSLLDYLAKEVPDVTIEYQCQ